MSDSLRPHELQHARPPCPSPAPRVHSDSHPLSQWCYPAISSSVVPFSSCPQSLPASGSFPMSQLFTWGGQSIGISDLASVLPKNTQDWSPLEWTGWIPLKIINHYIVYLYHTINCTISTILQEKNFLNNTDKHCQNKLFSGTQEINWRIVIIQAMLTQENLLILARRANFVGC